MTEYRIIVMTVHKAASMLLWNLLDSVSKTGGIPHFSENSGNFPKHWDLENDASPIAAVHGLVGPLRSLAPVADLAGTYILLQLRDPRDVLVSLFYSFCYSHPAPVGIDVSADRGRWIERGIDDFVLNDPVEWGPATYRRNFGSDALKQRYEAYCNALLGLPNVTLLRYEDMFADFATWWRGFAAGFEGMAAPEVLAAVKEKTRAELALPAEERIHEHKRRMIPGDHRNKLAPATIAALDRKFGTILETLGYI